MTPFYEDEAVTVFAGECLDVLAELADASVDSVCTDPPYGLEFMGREWDRFQQRDPRTVGRAGAGAITGDAGIATVDESLPSRPSGVLFDKDKRQARGVSYGGKRPMTLECDTCGVRSPIDRKHSSQAPDCQGSWVSVPMYPDAPSPLLPFQQWCQAWAAECLRVLKPGGFLLAFGGTRTYHRLTCAIEDAGFEIRDTVSWIYGSGFPKSLDVSKAIDRLRRRDYVLAAVELGLSIPGNNLHDWTKAEHSPGDEWWERFKAHLSPDDWRSVERAVVGRRTSGTTAGMQSIGPSGIRGGEYEVTAPATEDAKDWAGWGTALKPAHEPIVVARKPLVGTVAQNVLTHGTGALNVDACRVEASGRPAREKVFSGYTGDTYGTGRNTGLAVGTTDTGRWPTNVVLSHAPLLDESGEVVGDACVDGCVEGCPVAELDRQSGVLTSGANPTRRGSDKFRDTYGEFAGQEECTPARGAESGGASRFFPVFRYEAKADSAERPRVGGVAHPTVKPLDLMRWLVRLVTPSGGLVLDPFAGSGTTGEACVIEGFRALLIERESDYLPLIVARLTKPLQPALDVTP